MNQNKPNLKYDHVFTIIRIDDFQGSEVPIESKIAVQKILWSEEEAETETVRLNNLNSDKGCRYFWQIARLERR